MAGYMTFKSRTAGDILRNFGAADVTGTRGAYERAIKLCYGLSILGAIPLVILPFYNLVLPVLAGEDGWGGLAFIRPSYPSKRAKVGRCTNDAA